jgi:hypothetical protein
VRESYNNRTVPPADPACKPSLEALCFAFIPVVIGHVTQTDVGYRPLPLSPMDQRHSATGEFIRVAAKTRSWENAECKASLMEFNSDPLRPVPDATIRITIDEGVRGFLVFEAS